ncbi:MAG: HepT-like ribonuclease domain-containing protein, partial [Anditalea sp.]
MKNLSKLEKAAIMFLSIWKNSDIKTKRAIERDWEIIREAANRILKKDKSFKPDNAEKIIGTPNRIIHEYDRISDDLIWRMVINHLP